MSPTDDYLANDADPEETREWRDSLAAVVREQGADRARFLLQVLQTEAQDHQPAPPTQLTTPYRNTIAAADEPAYPGDADTELTYRRWVRWNAAVMVARAQRPGVGVGGHQSTYASAATLYEVGLNHFFRGKDHPGGGDHVFFQGHASPGNYARAFLEGRLSEADLDGFRQEVSRPAGGRGLPSYPHPRRMEDFWEFPTVSMGLGAAAAIYQAWFDRYLAGADIKNTSAQHTWAFLGDGEMDEPESRGMLQLAANQRLDNLTFVINCNLQRLDGPVRGNGSIIQELEASFRGAGWNVIKVIWGQGWDRLLAADQDHALERLMGNTPDGDYQTLQANDAAYLREHFFGRDPRAAKLVADWTDAELRALRPGGHDARKIYAAYQAALAHRGQPTVILAHTVKGYLLGPHFAGRNATHQMKRLSLEDLKGLRDRLHIPLTDAQLEADPHLPPYYRPAPDDPALTYMLERRRHLGGYLPERRDAATPLQLPGDAPYEVLKSGSGRQKVATTMALVRLLRELIKDPHLGRRLVPIVPDEARTFGLESLFPTRKIFNTQGQQYTPVDADLMLSYRESASGHIMHTGINEAGSAALFQAVGTSYATHGEPMIPVYIFYSMFGFQRTGDQFWAAGDQLTRGFIIGATAGRTTLVGEGTQHMDGHSPLIAATNEAVVSYDPAYAYEIRHLVRDALERWYGPDRGRDRNVMYYLTVYNEPILQPAEPEDADVEGIIRGIYRLDAPPDGDGPQVQLLASGAAVPWVRTARRLLAEEWGVRAGVWSVTSWNELRRDGLRADTDRFLHPDRPARTPYLTAKLAGAQGPFIATSDFDHLVPDQIRAWVPGSFYTLGADGYGLSDTRPAARRHYLIDAECVVVKALQALAAEGRLDRSVPVKALARYRLEEVGTGTSGSDPE
ncbi:pyruvate dehydrogenase (acetyl-transferring), homodimeric type [Actinomyces sp. MRS3W]|uniref:pyruvate dehydrogenase (acetyl-transferring), homodimeric type n=1 Tax=Actinomyces sp. MRS3W TaxID=2800796 RepID=UPI0028FDBB9F|nr:pyruvate dehydrogenase (acetyl-transferring), homodimeric type [Actinomyces sp. MRS3W]MDU0348130.1 pyruvate dehydrogenase (acetyl-transferring), homodimeric type [Actinomyces sp. MRS3W]